MQQEESIPVKELVPGIFARLVHGDLCSLSIVRIIKGSVLPEHKHVHEQITYMLEGQMDMVIGGELYHLTAGSVHVIPSNTPHHAIALTDVKVIDVFSPVREDYR